MSGTSTVYRIEVTSNGFRAWRGEELFADSSSMSTFLKVMETVANTYAEGAPVAFLCAEAAPGAVN